MDCRLLVTASIIIILLAIAVAAAAGLPLNMVYATSYEKSQTTMQINECGNYWFPINVICSNLNAQIQGDVNSVTVTGPEAVDAQEKENSQSFAPFP